MNLTKGIRQTASLLLVEDTPSLQMLYSTVLRKGGYDPLCASTGQEALTKFADTLPQVVLLDLMLPDCDGLVVMREMLALQPETRIIVITANGSVNTAVEATRAGAHDFLVKPLGDIRLIGAVANAMADTLRGTLPEDHGPTRLADAIDTTVMGQSDAMRAVYDKIAAVAKSMAPVFVLGESGTGKELCARAIHLKSARAKARFVAVNCTSLPVDAQEGELFGTTATAARPTTNLGPIKAGAALKADGGTLFLENVHDLTPATQAKLLNMLQQGTVTPLGSSDPLKVSVRLICAATRDPAEEMRAGRLREDLYYRLFVIPITMPPLRARGDDVNILARHFLTQIAEEEGKRFTGIAPDVMRLFRTAAWKGNMRELINVLRLAVVLNDGPIVTVDMLSPELRHADSLLHSGQDQSGGSTQNASDLLSGMTMAQIEELAILSAIRRHKGSVPKAARELDIAPSTIYRKREVWEQGDA
jgi:two-component system, repressor protein LuxO